MNKIELRECNKGQSKFWKRIINSLLHGIFIEDFACDVTICDQCGIQVDYELTKDTQYFPPRQSYAVSLVSMFLKLTIS